MNFVFYIAPWIITGISIIYLSISNDKLRNRIEKLEKK
jgi:hypothetical protein